MFQSFFFSFCGARITSSSLFYLTQLSCQSPCLRLLGTQHSLLNHSGCTDLLLQRGHLHLELVLLLSMDFLRILLFLFELSNFVLLRLTPLSKIIRLVLEVLHLSLQILRLVLACCHLVLVDGMQTCDLVLMSCFHGIHVFRQLAQFFFLSTQLVSVLRSSFLKLFLVCLELSLHCMVLLLGFHHLTVILISTLFGIPVDDLLAQIFIKIEKLSLELFVFAFNAH
mmetsp:Transcript_24192/g.59233  ORF Transcript_24192/g.59233 Transcript_24192/m.59233 type:complete len:225 (-) Transcript_24192:2348-3022(-)